MRFRIKDFGFITDCQATYIDNRGKRMRFKWSNVWISMINRCYNINDPSYKHYGAKGVYVSDEFKLASVFRDWYLANNPDVWIKTPYVKRKVFLQNIIAKIL